MLHDTPIQLISEQPAIVRCSVPEAANLSAGLRLLADGGAKSILILATAADKWDPDAVKPVLGACPVPVFGGVFPAIFNNRHLYDQGTLLVGLPQEATVQLLSGISGDRDDLLERVEDGELAQADVTSLTVLVDSRRSNAEYLVDSLYDVFGETMVVAGGGVGSLVERFVPGIFTNAGLETDAALLAGFKKPALQRFEHGWATLDGPHVITSADGTVLKSINHKPAAGAYMQAIESKTDWRFANEDFRKISSLYPLGIEQPSGPHLVRDPLSVDGTALVCVGEVPEGAIIQVLQGDKTGLVSAAGQVAREIVGDRQALRPPDPMAIFAWDCASRRKYLLDDFPEELDAISQEIPAGDQMVGALTLAEVASTPGGIIRLLNKSLVMSCL